MSLIDPLYFILFTTGLAVGFGHCIGMCGPIVVSLALNAKGKSIFVLYLLYSMGRIGTYAFLGGIMGATGTFTMVIAQIASLQKGAMIFGGLMVMIMGLAMTGWIPFGHIFSPTYNPNGMVSRGFRKFVRGESTFAYLLLGLVLGLLPCGPVYTALITAARAGMEAKHIGEGILVGMGIMFSFGVGTVPALFLVARLAGIGWLTSKAVIYKVSSVLMLIVGAYFVIRGIRF